MNLMEYMKLRMGKSNINALTTHEFKTFKIENKKGWYKRHKYLEITEEMLKSVDHYSFRKRKREKSIKITAYLPNNQKEVPLEPTICHKPTTKKANQQKTNKIKCADKSAFLAEVCPLFQKTFQQIENTTQNIYINGRAGTGKSTFLNYLRRSTRKKIAIVAPTGIAALNVGGQTIHSFFSFKPGFIDITALKPQRSRVLSALELLIIDEISMVRADVFDGIDATLRQVRKNNQPFGGVQLCVLGDLLQLAPVVTAEEKSFFERYYSSPFFFEANVYKKAHFVLVNFDTVHRQKDDKFINLLDAVRRGDCTSEDLEKLNSRVILRASPAPGTLVLTSTRANADSINQTQLAKLPGNERVYQAVFDGQFNLQSNHLPAPDKLRLKQGAQVMLVKNDNEKRWANGTLAVVEQLYLESISVRIHDKIYEIGPEKWDTIKYELDEKKDKLAEKSLGSYRQLPVTLAWAITIHKSQGKTLARIIIDLGQQGAFAAGQLYVALSRCQSLGNIAIKQPITLEDVRYEPKVKIFLQELEKNQKLLSRC